MARSVGETAATRSHASRRRHRGSESSWGEGRSRGTLRAHPEDRRMTSHASPAPATSSTTAATPVPLMDPKRVYDAWGPEAEKAVVRILREHSFVKGPEIDALEKES